MYSYFKNAREPMSSYTHFLGVIFAVVGTVFLFWLLAARCWLCTVPAPSITITKVLS